MKARIFSCISCRVTGTDNKMFICTNVSGIVRCLQCCAKVGYIIKPGKQTDLFFKSS